MFLLKREKLTNHCSEDDCSYTLVARGRYTLENQPTWSRPCRVTAQPLESLMLFCSLVSFWTWSHSGALKDNHMVVCVPLSLLLLLPLLASDWNSSF